MAGIRHTRVVAPVAVLAIALLSVLALLVATGGEAIAGNKCAKSNASPGEATSEQLGEAVLCIIGKERRKADAKQVDEVGSLTRVAEKHTEVMVDQNCLDHRCKGEKSLNDRIVNSGYPIPGGRYGFGEVTGCSLTPQAMVDAWMDKRFHRKVILGKAYRDVGIGSAKASLNLPRCEGRRGVYTVIFGWRKR